VSVAKVNILDVELNEPLDEAGFRHVAASVGGRLGARRIGASVYQPEKGLPIWPYHYHHGIEEWLYVIAGAPVLREPAGERTLAPGDVVCFPSGPLGAHTMRGPGRFMIFATGQHDEPWMSVYPDSDKVSGPEGILLRGKSGCWFWPVRPRCATRRARSSSTTAISCAFMKARPVRTGWSMVGGQSCARSPYRRRACRPLCAFRTPGTGCFGTAAMTSSSASPADQRDGSYNSLRLSRADSARLRSARTTLDCTSAIRPT
jgi:uncharacterized cupin superfamily protein